MTFVIDYDDTYTADPEYFDAIIELGRVMGHKYYCLTQRRDTPENREDVKCKKAIVLFTNMASKVWHMENLGIKVDIWIDDDMKSALHGK